MLLAKMFLDNLKIEAITLLTDKGIESKLSYTLSPRFTILITGCNNGRPKQYFPVQWDAIFFLQIFVSMDECDANQSIQKWQFTTATINIVRWFKQQLCNYSQNMEY